MNKVFSILLCGAFGFLVLLPFACTRSVITPSQITPPAATPVPTSTPMPITYAAVTATGAAVFSPSAVTITHGGAVTFILGGGFHSLYIDDGAGTCAQNYASWPQTITFLSVGTYSFHCQYHSGCGTASCSGCTGMTGQVFVQ